MRQIPPSTDTEIPATLDLMHHLHPTLTPETYLARIRALTTSDRFRLTAAVEDGAVRA